VSGQAVAMAPATSPSVISRMRAPAARTEAMRSAWRGRSRMATARSGTEVPLALATAFRLSSMGAVMSITPTARGPTASFSM
jgi:hypothetical protein